VRERPAGVSDPDVAEALRRNWGIEVDRIEYAPVGFGSYHWKVATNTDRWFVTVDDLIVRRRDPDESDGESLGRLSAALATARALSDAGSPHVVPPRPSTSGHIVEALDDRFAISVYPYVDGESHSFGSYRSRDDRLAVLELLTAVHAATESVRGVALDDDFVIPSRGQLLETLGDRDAPFGDGPFGEPARVALMTHADALLAASARYDVLVADVREQTGRMVLTHGEPHPANTIETVDGLVLIDWDTALIAPPERDLWAMVDEDPGISDEYTARTGSIVDRDALDVYRLWWDISEIALFVAGFQQLHADTADTRIAFNVLTQTLDDRRWDVG
jgi:spectinomycin phosphotransferase